ncbi:T9SS type A sorting domain-containing protein [Candidatus Margulisiibacteriota bacterium]
MKKILSILLISILFSFSLWGATILALPSITIDSRSTTLDITGISDESGVPLSGSGTIAGDLVQIIDLGDDGNINVPNMVNLGQTGDDTLLATVNIGWGFPASPNAGLFSKTINVDTGKTIYIRAWNASGNANATYYGDSETYLVSSSLPQTFFAGVFGTTKNRDLTAPSVVPLFNADPGARSVELSWQNSPSTDMLGTLVVRSTSDITWNPENYKDYLDSLDFADIDSRIITDGIKLIHTGTNTSGSDTGLIADETYYYAAFAYDNMYNYAAAVKCSAVPTSGITIESGTPFTYIESVAGDAKVELSWAVSTTANQYTTYEIWRVSANSENNDNYPVSRNNPAEMISSGNFDDGTYTDENLVNYKYYYYAIFGKKADSSYSAASTTHSRPETQSTYKAYNYPNPFSPGTGQSTSIVFPLDSDGTYNLYLINIVGEVAWTSRGSGTAGSNTVIWDGRNDWGNVAPNGVYLLRVVQGGKLAASGKVSVLD